MNTIYHFDWLELTWKSAAVPPGAILLEENIYREPYRYDHYTVAGTPILARRYETETPRERDYRCILTGKFLRGKDWRACLGDLALDFGIPTDFLNLSRVDFAWDLEVEQMPFFRPSRQKNGMPVNVTTRAKRFSVVSSPSGVTYYFGGGPLFLRIYDKTGEMTRSGRPDRLLEYREHYGLNAEQICRVEFQVRREALKKLGLGTACDLVEGHLSAASKLVNHWFYIPLRKTKDRNFQYSAFWTRVVNSVGQHPFRGPVPHLPADASHLVRAAMGTLRAAYACATYREPDPDMFRAYCLDRIRKFEPADGWQEFFEPMT